MIRLSGEKKAEKGQRGRTEKGTVREIDVWKREGVEGMRERD